MDLTHERLKSLLVYDPATGRWRWLANRRGGRGIKIGDEAGSINSRRDGPRRVIKVDGVKFLSSRLAFFYMTGHWPTYQVDHENLNTLDDRWSNLKERRPIPKTRATSAHLKITLPGSRASGRLATNTAPK